MLALKRGARSFLLKPLENESLKDLFTDIITFQYPSEKLSAEIFISIPRVRENAKKFKVSFEDELHRFMIHGILHLCGYKDKTPTHKKKMRKREESRGIPSKKNVEVSMF